MKKKMEISLKHQPNSHRDLVPEKGNDRSLTRVHSHGPEGRVLSGSSSITRQCKMVSPNVNSNSHQRYPSRNRDEQHFLSQGVPNSGGQFTDARSHISGTMGHSVVKNASIVSAKPSAHPATSKKKPISVSSSQNIIPNPQMSIYSSVRTAANGPSFREDENEKLNNLIEDYRRENERCSQKIHELQEKLNMTTNKFVQEGGRNAMLGNHASSFGSRGTLGATDMAGTRSS